VDAAFDARGGGRLNAYTRYAATLLRNMLRPQNTVRRNRRRMLRVLRVAGAEFVSKSDGLEKACCACCCGWLA